MRLRAQTGCLDSHDEALPRHAAFRLNQVMTDPSIENILSQLEELEPRFAEGSSG
jgi:hypothetical protein